MPNPEHLAIMNTLLEELFEIAERLDALYRKCDLSEIKRPLEQLEEAVDYVGKSWSGSWLGYHSRVFYENLQPPPPGAHFSQQWGLRERVFATETVGDWLEYDYDDVHKLYLR